MIVSNSQSPTRSLDSATAGRCEMSTRPGITPRPTLAAATVVRLPAPTPKAPGQRPANAPPTTAAPASSDNPDHRCCGATPGSPSRPKHPADAQPRKSTRRFSSARKSSIVTRRSGDGSLWPSNTLLPPISESIAVTWPPSQIIRRTSIVERAQEKRGIYRAF